MTDSGDPPVQALEGEMQTLRAENHRLRSLFGLNHRGVSSPRNHGSRHTSSSPNVTRPGLIPCAPAVLRCTKKLRDVLRPPRVSAPESGDDDWYANLLVLDRRKCLLLTHTATLFSVFEPNVRVGQIRSTRELVARLVERELREEQLPPETFGDVRSEELVIAKTADRSVLGCMNDMVFLAEVAVDQSGGVASLDNRALNRRLRRNINSARDYRRPVDLIRERLVPQRPIA
jgi:hypothetical protein